MKGESVLNNSLRAKYHCREKCKQKLYQDEYSELEGLAAIVASINTLRYSSTVYIPYCLE